MTQVKRMYCISHSSEKIIRGWQAHQKEEKWFFCISGQFQVKLIKLKNFLQPSSASQVSSYSLSSDIIEVLHVPAGYASSIKANSENAKLLVYSNFTLEESLGDDYRFTLDTWNVWEK
jgi:dTDP-4-dehydrorhamnose 3,5-epimerase